MSVSTIKVWEYYFSTFGLSVAHGYCLTREDCLAVKEGLHFVPSEDQTLITEVLVAVIDGRYYLLKPLEITKPSRVQPGG